MIIIMSEIKAHEECDVATVNSTGTYLHTEYNKCVIMLLRRRLMNLIAMVGTKLYVNYVTKDQNGQTFLYGNVLNSLYGLLKSVLIFYRKLVKYLEDYGLKTNPHNPCIANEIINGKQMAVTWHMD